MHQDAHPHLEFTTKCVKGQNTTSEISDNWKSDPASLMKPTNISREYELSVTVRLQGRNAVCGHHELTQD